jgi:hypothetical protein
VNESAEADARLIAAAPDLLQALKGFEIREHGADRWLHIGSAMLNISQFGTIIQKNISDQIAVAASAVAKAEGRS